MSEKRPDYLSDALEMAGIDFDTPKQIIQEVSGFTPLFDVVVQQYKDETRAAVHGAMWRYCQMEDGVCKASLSTIGDLLGISPATVMRHAEELCKDGYFLDLTPDLKNRPHVYADTGKVVMKSKIHVSQRNTGISQRNVGISESQLSKDIKKDSNKQYGADAPSLPLEWEIAGDKPIAERTQPKDSYDRAKAIDAANLIGTGAAGAESLALAFQDARRINLSDDPAKVKGQRKAAKEMLAAHVKPEHVTAAVKSLIEKGMTITDLFSVMKTAIDLANPVNKPDLPPVTINQNGIPESY